MVAILTTPPDGDRRQMERKPLSVRVRLAPAGRPEMEVRSLDVAPQRISLIVEVNLAPGTACNLTFALPLSGGSAHKVQVDASVIHSTYSRKRNGFVIGLQFKGASAELQAALGRYMKG